MRTDNLAEKLIFISYRREDCLPHARLLAASLESATSGEVFLDVDALTPGMEFPTEIRNRIERSAVMIALIGDEWLGLHDGENLPRVASTDDWVRREIALAIELRKPIVPVLVEGASMPSSEQLPEDIRPLADRNAIELRDRSWPQDHLVLVEALVALAGEKVRPRGERSDAFPHRFTDRWFADHVPEMDDESFAELRGELTRRNWSEAEIRDRVSIHRGGSSREPSYGTRPPVKVERPPDDLIDDADPVARATVAAAAELDLRAPEQRTRERDLAAAIAGHLERSTVERRLRVPGWTPEPGGVDLYASDRRGRPTLVIETKLKSDNSLFECLWDMAKVASLLEVDSIEAGYLVAGTTVRNWEKPIACADMFEPGTYRLVNEIERYSEWWEKYILGDSTGRPDAVPESVNTHLVARARCRLNETDWEIRALSLSVDGDTGWVPFSGGWPQR